MRAALQSLAVPGEIAVELRFALRADTQSRRDRILERIPIRVLVLLNRDVVGQLARAAVYRRLLQLTCRCSGEVMPGEITITEAAGRLLAIRLLTEHRDASMKFLASTAALPSERWMASKRAELLSEFLHEAIANPLAGPEPGAS